MPRQHHRDADHDIHGDELGLGERKARGKPTQTGVDRQQEDDVEHDAPWQGHDRGVAGVPDSLDRHDPVDVERDQHGPEHEGAHSNGVAC